MTKRCPGRAWYPAPVQDPALRRVLRITDARRFQAALGERVHELGGSKERLLQRLRLQYAAY